MRAGFQGVIAHPNKIPAHTYWWLEHLVNKIPEKMAPLPCNYLKCTSMIMDTVNFSINYSIPFIPNLLKTPQELPNPAAEKITSPSKQLFSNSTHQVSQTSFGYNKTSLQMLNKRSNVKMILQYLGTGFSVTNEIINPKDEVSMFQQICGGESVCVFKGYLSSGENFQMVSRRHYGYPFSASMYINGLIAARISSCCEYRYRVGFQQGRRGCFRIIELSGGKPCYRCGALYDQRKKIEDHSVSITCEESTASQERVSEITNIEKASDNMLQIASQSLSPITLSTQPRHQKRKVRKKKRRPPQNESESEQENKLRSKHHKYRRPPVKEIKKGQQPALPLQSNANTGECDKTYAAWKCHVTHAISKDTTVSSADKEEKLESSSPGTENFRKDDTHCQLRTSRREEPKSAVTIKPRRARREQFNVNGGRIQTQEDSMQAIHHRLVKALSEICLSEVELSDSSDSTDIHSITEETWTPKMISSEEMTQPMLAKRVTTENKKEDNWGEDETLEPVMSSIEEPTRQESDQQVTAEKNVEKAGEDGARCGPPMSFNHGETLQGPDQQEEKKMEEGLGEDITSRPPTSSNHDSTVQGPDQQEGKKMEEGLGEGETSRPPMSSSEESTIPAAAPRKEEDEVADGEINVTAERADEEGLFSQITDLIAVLQECDEVDQLVLRNTGMTDSLLLHLMPALMASKSEVESLNLNLNEIGPGGVESLIQLLRAKPCIRSLLLYGNRLGGKGIKTLLCGLSEILIAQRQMNATLPYNAPLVQLSELDVGGNHMSDEALRSVADYLRLNPVLKHLGLAHISVHSAATWQELFDAMKINTNLTHLLLDENGLGDTGARLVAEVIQVNRSLVCIDLDGNDIGEEGGEAIAESLASASDTTVTTISLDNNQISQGTMSAIQTLLMIKGTDQ